MGEVFFTDPVDVIRVRSTDPLGFRAVADQYAEKLAPGLNNRICDGRWFTILSWCLVRAREAAGAGVAPGELYEWLRPLELMWIASAVSRKDLGAGRQLPGRRAIERWVDSSSRASDFGMSRQQRNAYRQSGIYGAYRRAFREWEGATSQGDGWTPLDDARGVSNWLNEKLGACSLRISKRGDAAGKAEWWLKKWKTYEEIPASLLPTAICEPRKLPPIERKHLRSLIFGRNWGKRREKIACEVGQFRGNVILKLYKNLEEYDCGGLAAFYQFTEAARKAVEQLREMFDKRTRIPISDLCKRNAGTAAARSAMNDLRSVARDVGAACPIVVKELAETLAGSDPAEAWRLLIDHHIRSAGGRRWFKLDGDVISLDSPPKGASSPYTFRLWNLCRLAVQCGVIESMPKAFTSEPDWDGEVERR